MIWSEFTLIATIDSIAMVILVVALAGCGDPSYLPPPIVVTFYSPPPATLETGATAGVTAVVTNDSKNAGARFSCVPVGDCGTFTPNPIASNVPTSYQAPSTVPTGGTVTIEATS